MNAHTSLAAYSEGQPDIALVERHFELGEQDVLVETRQASICDADLRFCTGMHWPADMPPFEWLGHEGGGVVLDTGKKVRNFKAGDKVMLFGPCGSWSKQFKAPERALFKLPDGMPDHIGYLGEPVAVGMFGLFESGVRIGDDVAVVGLNFQGLIALQGLRRSGARRVIAVDYSKKHLELAKEFGADEIIDTNSTDAISAIRDLTKGKGVDVAFHSCGYWNPRAEEYFNIAVEIARDEGIICSVPDIMSPIRANLHRIHHHGLDIRFPALMHHGPAFMERWVQRVLRPVADGLINIDKLITGEYPLAQAKGAMDHFIQDPDQIKIVLKP